MLLSSSQAISFRNGLRQFGLLSVFAPLLPNNSINFAEKKKNPCPTLFSGLTISYLKWISALFFSCFACNLDAFRYEHANRLLGMRRLDQIKRSTCIFYNSDLKWKAVFLQIQLEQMLLILMFRIFEEIVSIDIFGLFLSTISLVDNLNVERITKIKNCMGQCEGLTNNFCVFIVYRE